MTRTPSVELTRRIASAALCLLADEGIGAVTHRAVAAAAGVSTTSVANRFGTRATLLDHLALRGFVELVEVIMHDPGGPLTEVEPDRRLTEALERYERWALANPALHRLMFDAPSHGVTPSPATRRAAVDLRKLMVAAARSERRGWSCFAETHGRVQLALAELAFPPPPAGP